MKRALATVGVLVLGLTFAVPDGQRLCSPNDVEGCVAKAEEELLALQCRPASFDGNVSVAPYWALGGGELALAPCTVRKDRARQSPTRLDNAWHDDAATALSQLKDSQRRKLAETLLALDVRLQRDPWAAVVKSTNADASTRGQAIDDPALPLLRAQALARTGSWTDAAEQARGVVDRAPFDRRALAARLLMARAFGLKGQHELALEQCREVQRWQDSKAPEVVESRRLAATIWIHEHLRDGKRLVLKPEAPFTVQGADGRVFRPDAIAVAGSVLALAGRDGVAFSRELDSRRYVTQPSLDDRCWAIASTPEGDFVARCASRVRRFALFVDDHGLVQLYPDLLVDPAPQSNRDAPKEIIELVRESKQGGVLAVDLKGRPWFGVDRASRVAYAHADWGQRRALADSIRVQPVDLNGISALLRRSDGSVCTVNERPQGRDLGLSFASDQSPKPLTAASELPRKIVAAAVDALDWIYLLGDRPEGRAASISVVNDQKRVIHLADSALEHLVGIAVDDAGRIYVASRKGQIQRFVWSIER